MITRYRTLVMEHFQIVQGYNLCMFVTIIGCDQWYIHNTCRYLGNNHIQQVTLYTFADLVNLKVLRLGNNQISFIEAGSFARLTLLNLL